MLRATFIMQSIADPRRSASKVSPLPPTILAPATLFLLPQSSDMICMGLHTQDMQHEHFPCKFPNKVAAGTKIYTFHSKTGIGAANVKSCTLTVKLQAKAHVACCVACVLHVCCMCVAWQACRIEQSRSQFWRACHAER